MTKERTFEEIKYKVEDLGYELLDELTINKGKRRVIIEDRLGYKYVSDFYNLCHGYIPSIAETKNQFSLHNISLWLELEKKSFVLCEGNVYKGSLEKLSFQCTKESCGEIFDMSWHKIYAGKGCPYCAGQKVGRYNNLAYLRPELVKEWNYDKNKEKPENYTYRSNQKVFWICSECKHPWDAQINSRSNGSGCPKCAQSKGEKRILEWLLKNWESLKRCGFINEPISQHKFSDCKNKRTLPFDFGIENYKNEWVIIEYYGKQHFTPIDFFGGEKEFKKRKTNDRIKRKYCEDNGIILLIISYQDFHNIENILDEYFSEMMRESG